MAEAGVGLFVATSDKNNSVHPIVFSLTNGENQECFENALAVIKDNKPQFAPTVVMADAAEAFPNACRNLWDDEDILRLMCYSHTDRVSLLTLLLPLISTTTLTLTYILHPCCFYL